jgi:hypothetical protein
MKIFTIILCFLFLLMSSCIIVPNYDTEWTFPEIKGFVLDSSTNLPIGNAWAFEKNYGDTIQTDSTGHFIFQATKEYIKWRFIAMDGPEPYIHLRFEKPGYSPKEITIKYIKIDYKRKLPDSFDLKNVRLYRLPLTRR